MKIKQLVLCEGVRTAGRQTRTKQLSVGKDLVLSMTLEAPGVVRVDYDRDVPDDVIPLGNVAKMVPEAVVAKVEPKAKPELKGPAATNAAVDEPAPKPTRKKKQKRTKKG